MDESLAPASNDPDSSLPSLFPYDSFPIPRGLYTESNSSRASIGRYERKDEEDQLEEDSREFQAVSTPRGKILVGQDLQNTLRRPSGGMKGLAPALPVSPPRSGSSKSSPATSPIRSRRINTADLRNLAQKQRTRDFQGEDGDFASQRASRSTIASFTSTESIYEDAIEPDSDTAEAEEHLPDMYPPLLAVVLPPLNIEQLPDTPPELELPDREPRSRQITPKPNHHSEISSSLLASPTPLSPEVVASLDERTLYERRQVQLQAEARRRGSTRLSISSLPVSPRGPVSPSYRRHSGILPISSPRQASHIRRLSLSSASSPPVSGSRHWHPKPLVLTPARTMSTPLTSEPSLSSASPQRHLSAQEGSLDGHLRTHSRASSCYDGTIRTVSPLSPGGYSAGSRPTSPFQSSPRRQSSLSVNPRRRSLGYVDSSNETLSTFGRRAMGHNSRGRSASEDTGATRTTVDSTMTRFTMDDETPESSSGGWSDERKPSPLLDDREWEQQWQVNGSSGGTPLESVAEVSLGTIKTIDFAEEEEEESPKAYLQQFSSTAPIVRRRAATEDRKSTTSGSSRSNSIVEMSLATIRPSSIRRDSVPPTPPPKMPLPRPPPARHNSSPLPTKRSRQRYDESWNGVQDQSSTSSQSVGDEDSDDPVSPKRPSNTMNANQQSSPRRPIVIKGSTPRSAAALARRSARLSLVDPPLPPPSASATSDRYSTYSDEQRGGSRSSSRASRHTGGHSSREASQEARYGRPPLSTLAESETSPMYDFSPRFLPRESDISQGRSERSQSRTSYSSPRISIGSTFANGFGATRRVELEPRDPRTREELDAGSGSYLEVLLYSEPPARSKPPSARWSSVTSSTTAQSSSKESIGSPFIRSDSPPSIPTTTANKNKSGNNFAQKFFGGFKGKNSQTGSKPSSSTVTRRPLSLMSQDSSRRPQKDARPIVSGPLELERAKLDQNSEVTNPQNLSVSFAPPIPIMKSYTSLARVYEEESTHSHLNRSASLETIDRPPPRPFSLPPGLVTSASKDSLKPPVPPVKPPRSPLRSQSTSPNDLLRPASPRAVSPVHSFKSFQSQQPSIRSGTGRSTPSTSEPIGVRDVLRGQFLER
ncbi:hypothetical protein JCM5350_007872 [Sporobolomyces pararoseus]